MRKVLKIKLKIVVLFLCLCFVGHSGVVYLKEFTFDEDGSLDKWKKVILNGEVDYTLIKYGDDGYVRAFSEKACSALYYKVRLKLKDYSLLKWKWMVLQFPDVSRATTEEERNDYAARVYVIFPHLSFSRSKFIEYVWAEDLPVETIINSPFGDNVKMMVVRSGKTTGEEWVSEVRNVYEDYIKVFGKDPGIKVGAIAIMCDSDGTKTSAESLFDDIVIESQEML